MPPAAWDVAVAGTIHLDDVTTPLGRRTDQIGGSALYFTLAAARQAAVRMCSIVGTDCIATVRALLSGLPVETEGLEVVDIPTFRWEAVHDFEHWVTASEAYTEGADSVWQARLPPAAAVAPVFFVGSMAPARQLDVIGQSSAKLIGSDSMTVFIGSEGETVRAVAAASDILFFNRIELATLVPGSGDDWVMAARRLLGGGRLRAVVVKRGPEGAACVTATRVIDKPAHPIATVVDPTGAGDALAGGFLGACARAGRVDDDYFATALDEGLLCAAGAIGTFGTAGLRTGHPHH